MVCIFCVFRFECYFVVLVSVAVICYLLFFSKSFMLLFRALNVELPPRCSSAGARDDRQILEENTAQKSLPAQACWCLVPLLARRSSELEEGENK